MSTLATSAVTAAATLPKPEIEYSSISPVLIVLGAAVLGVLVEAFLPRGVRRVAQLVVAFGGLLAALVAVVLLADGGDHELAAEGALAIDGPTLFMQGTILVLALAAFPLFAERTVDGEVDAFTPSGAALPGSDEERLLTRARVELTEVYPLAMFAVGGMLVFPAANDLLVMFVALEVLSLPLYLLCALARRRRLLSQEAALKYFILGSFASAFFLYGAALLYGYAGSVDLADIAEATRAGTGNEAYLAIGTALVAVGLLFKVSAAPFHQWTPDVYQGAPTAVTAFMAACTKVAAFGALLRLFYVALGTLRWDWRPMMWGVAILTMVVGTVLALTQTDIKRMLAYSSVAHAGFLLAGVVATDQSGLRGTVFYLLVYGLATVGSFAVVTLVRDEAGEATHLSQWAGLGKRSPVVASVFALFLLSLAGIPLTSGFPGKFAVFAAAFEGGAAPVAIVGVLASAAAAFFYVRVIVLMFFSEPAADGPRVVLPSVFTSASVALTAGATLVLGIVPGPVLDLADRASLFLR